MKLLMFSIFALLLTASGAGLAKDAPAKGDLEKLSGTWLTVSIVSDGKTVVDEKSPPKEGPTTKLIYDGNKWMVKVGDKTVASGIIKVDSSKTPKEIDVMDESGKKNDKTKLAIYELDGDTFKYCIASAGKPRPAEFTAKEGSGNSLIVMKREKPVPATAPAGDDKPAKADKPEAKKPVYDEKADGKAQIEAALASAKRENRRVLIQWGGNWCHWCLLLNDRFQKDRELAKELRYEYDVVHVDIGKMDKHLDLVKKYDADVKKNGVPFLTVLDADGKVLANQATDPFETKSDTGEQGHDPKKLLEFLKTHEAKPLKADDVLTAALAKAGKTERKVFLHFGAPWCGWCLRLDAWLQRPEVAKILGEDYLEVKIDQDRMTNAKEVLARYNKDQKGGIPWFVVLDAKGKALVTSDGSKGNIGFPAEKDEIAHFVTMLNTTKKRITDKQIEELVKSLTPPKKDETPR
jgi:uncharacterized protein (TIGR03067 family)